MESINMFGGMNSDLSSFIQNTEKYLKALNVRPVTDLGMSNGALTNVRGNNCEIQFPTLRAVYRFSIYVPVGFTENEGMSITINGVTSATFSVFNASSLSSYLKNTSLNSRSGFFTTKGFFDFCSSIFSFGMIVCHFCLNALLIHHIFVRWNTTTVTKKRSPSKS